MTVENKAPKRKPNRLENYNYASSGAYFITICTKNRESLFWVNDQPNFVGEDIILPPNHVRLSWQGAIVAEAIEKIPQFYPHIQLLQYVIMPNHVHLILYIPYDCGRIISSPTSILTAVGQMKRYASKRIGSPIWQKSFHDHIIRNNLEYEKISRYMHENPIKWQFDCFYTPK